MTQVLENIIYPGYCFYQFYAHIFKVLAAKFFIQLVMATFYSIYTNLKCKVRELRV